MAIADKLGCKFVPTDVTQSSDVGAALDALESYGDGAVNTVINCAGVAPGVRVFHPKRGPHPLESFEQTLMINVAGSFNVLRLAVERMMAEEPVDGLRGVIINTASVAAFDGQIGQAAYAASKAAIAGMTLPLARDLGKSGVRCCTIAPGTFETPMLAGLKPDIIAQLESGIPCPSRLGKPDEYASLAEHIINNAYLNGEVIRLDGSLRMG
jgi:NAD(P)-dependent dehydrogenase (short-subunit alcohol dehydrogenase family)